MDTSKASTKNSLHQAACSAGRMAASCKTGIEPASYCCTDSVNFWVICAIFEIKQVHLLVYNLFTARSQPRKQRPVLINNLQDDGLAARQDVEGPFQNAPAGRRWRNHPYNSPKLDHNTAN